VIFGEARTQSTHIRTIPYIKVEVEVIGLDFPLITLIGIAGKRKKFLTCTQKNNKSKA
jgi:hypothetical protein